MKINNFSWKKILLEQQVFSRLRIQINKKYKEDKNIRSSRNNTAYILFRKAASILVLLQMSPDVGVLRRPVQVTS
jgi:hypothetical protein